MKKSKIVLQDVRHNIYSDKHEGINGAPNSMYGTLDWSELYDHQCERFKEYWEMKYEWKNGRNGFLKREE